MRIRNIADVQDDRGFLHFFESGAKRGEQSFWEIADESDCVGHEDAAVGGETDGADRRVECREHARGDEDFGMAERIEERRFAGVGVADKRDGAQRNGVARVAAQRALLADFVDRFLNFGDAIANAAAVGFEFFFAGTANTDATCATTRTARPASAALAAKARHRGTLSGEARQHVVELCKLDLELAFTASCVLRKDIEDELRAINHATLGCLFDVALLHRREVAVENDERGFMRRGFGTDLIEFAAAYECGRIGGIAHLMNRAGDVSARAASEFDEFVERVLALRGEHVRRYTLCALECNADQHNTFGGGGGLRYLHRSAWREHRSRGFRLRITELYESSFQPDYTLRSRALRVWVAPDAKFIFELALQSAGKRLRDVIEGRGLDLRRIAEAVEPLHAGFSTKPGDL